MEEQQQNQNQEKDIVEKTVEQGKKAAEQAAKDEAKKLGKLVAKKIGTTVVAIMPHIIPFIIGIIIISLLIGGFWEVIQGLLMLNSGKAQNNIRTMITIGENGPTMPSKEEMLEIIDAELENTGIDKKSLNLGEDEQANEYLYKYILASFSTQLPYIESNKNGQGIVRIKRKNETEEKELEYKTYELFSELIEENNEDALNYFSIDDTWMLCIAKFEEVVVEKKKIEEDKEKDIETETQYKISEEKIPYQTMISNYSVPFSFLITLQQFTGNAEYVSAVADLIQEQGRIDLTILDSTEIITSEYTYKYDVQKKWVEEIEVVLPTIPDNSNNQGTEENNNQTENNEPNKPGRPVKPVRPPGDGPQIMDRSGGIRIATSTPIQDALSGKGTTTSQPQTEKSEIQKNEITSENNVEIKKTTTTTNKIQVSITYADVWVISHNSIYNLETPPDEYPLGEDGYTPPEQPYNEDEPEGKEAEWKVNITENTKETINKKTWKEQSNEAKIDPGKFLGLWKNDTGTYVQGALFNPDGKEVAYPLPPPKDTKTYPFENIDSADEMFCKILENNDETQMHGRIMRELIKYYKDPSYTIDVDLSIFNASIFNASEFTEGSYVGGGFDVHNEDLFITDLETLKRALGGGYSNSGNLVANAEGFLQMQRNYKVNALFAAAVSITETSAGNKGNAVNGCHNWFNITGKDGPYKTTTNAGGETHNWRIYASDAEGIGAFGNLIANSRYYYKNNKYSVTDIGSVYCPNTPAYPTQAEGWSSNTMSYITKFYNAAGINMSDYTYAGGSSGVASKDLASLFPSGIPTSESEMSPYLTTISVPINDKNGNKTTGNLRVHKAVANDVISIFQEIQESGFKAYSLSAYSWRSAAASSSRSHHSYGVAIDINPNENYMIKNGSIISGSLWKPGENQYSITPNGPVVNAFARHGWTWGGTWKSSKDYMHFSLTGH